jgi:hypothetical protein
MRSTSAGPAKRSATTVPPTEYARRVSGAADVLAALGKVRGVRVVKDPEIGTNLDAPEDPGLLVTRAVSEGEGVVRLWVLGSEPGALAAARALELASAAGAFVNAS